MTKQNKLTFVSTYTIRDRKTPGLSFDAPSRTRQSFRDECDINILMKKYGALPPPNRVPQFGDFSEIGTYFEARQRVLKAQEAFSELPVAVQERFRGNLDAFFAFLQDPKNTEEAVKLGLVEAEARGATEPAAPANPPTPPTDKKPAV